MKLANFFSAIFSVLCLHVSAEQLFESEAYVFSADTTGSAIVITDATDGVSLWCRAGEKISAVEMFSHVTVMPVVSAETTGLYSWNPSAGGVWRLENAKEGSVTVNVRYSLFSEQIGSEESPARFVDSAELTECIGLAASGQKLDGYVFFVTDNMLIDDLPLYHGFRIENVGDGQYRFSIASGNEVYVAEEEVFAVDSVKSGPDRRVRRGTFMNVSYSGDNWMRKSNVASALTLISPSGKISDFDCFGTGAEPVTFNELGAWLLRLEVAGKTLEAEVNVIEPRFTVIIR